MPPVPDTVCVQPPAPSFKETAAARILIKTSLYLLPYSDIASRCLDACGAVNLFFDPFWNPVLGSEERRTLDAMAPGTNLLSWVAANADQETFVCQAAALKEDPDRYTLLLWLRQIALNFKNPLPPLHLSSCNQKQLLSDQECFLGLALRLWPQLEGTCPGVLAKFPATMLLTLLTDLNLKNEEPGSRELLAAVKASTSDVVKVLELKDIEKQNLLRSKFTSETLALYCALLKCACRWYQARRKGGAAAIFAKQLRRSFKQRQQHKARRRRQLEELCAQAVPGFAACDGGADGFIRRLMEQDQYLLWQAPRLRLITGMFSAYNTYRRMRALSGPEFELELENLTGLKYEQVLFLLRLDQTSCLSANAASG